MGYYGDKRLCNAGDSKDRSCLLLILGDTLRVRSGLFLFSRRDRRTDRAPSPRLQNAGVGSWAGAASTRDAVGISRVPSPSSPAFPTWGVFLGGWMT